MISRLRGWLAHPLTRGRDIDDPETTFLRRAIVEEKYGLRRVYAKWYQTIVDEVPKGRGYVLELGSGAGFLAEWIPDVVTSDVFPLPHVGLVADACNLPFGNGALRAIVMVDVFHHIPDVRAFLTEAARVLRPGGRVLMIEPWVTPLASLIYRHLHHEPFRPESSEWTFPSSGPLSGANGALPWIVFRRDVAKLASLFPELRIRTVEPTTVLTYLLAGGVSMRTLIPTVVWPIVEFAEGLLSPLRAKLAMFAFIVLERE